MLQSLKIINASHARSILKYVNTKLKLLNCNGNNNFNEIFLEQNLTPEYAQTNWKNKPVHKTVQIIL
jgi:hypothetical protein